MQWFIQELPVHQRADAVSSLVYEANARVRDPVYGCVGAISYLQNQVSELQMQLAVAQAEILCIQMEHEPVMPASQIDLDHKSYFLQNDLSQFLAFDSSSNVMQQFCPWHGFLNEICSHALGLVYSCFVFSQSLRHFISYIYKFFLSRILGCEEIGKGFLRLTLALD